MKFLRLFLVLVAAVLAAAPATAAVLDSTAFPYQQNDLTANADFSLSDVTDAGGGMMNFIPTSRINGLTWAAQSANLINTGYTIEARLQIHTMGTDGFGFGIMPADGADIAWFGMRAGDVFTHYDGYGPSNFTTQSWGGGTNSNDFHVFRMSHEPGAANLSIWKDGELLTTTGTMLTGWNADTFLGAGVISQNGAYGQLDYIRWTPGAYEPPVPEPSTSTTAVLFDYNSGTTGANVNTVGWRFGLSQDIIVTTLGCLNGVATTGNSQAGVTHEVGIYSETTQALLTSATVTNGVAGSTDQWQWTDLSSPLTLSAGDVYRIATNSNGDNWTYNTANFSAGPELLIGPDLAPGVPLEDVPGSRVATFEDGNLLQYPAQTLWDSDTIHNGFFGANFKYTLSAIELVPVTWTGVGGPTWSTASGSNNWKATADDSAANYANGVDVIFDDSAIGSLTVDISAANVTPSSVVFNNTANDFVLTGAKGIAGTTGVLKQGAGTVTLLNANTYTGVTTIEDGTLIMSEVSYANVAANGGADIQGGRGILDYSTTGVSPAPEIQAALAASYNNGAWDIGQIRNTTAATTGLTLGWIDDAASNQLTIMATYAGDADVSGKTDVGDLTRLLNNYNKTGMVWSNGDFNYDGLVNVADLTALLNKYNKTVGAGLAAGANWNVGSHTVPEPSVFVLLTAGLLGLLAYTWRKRS